VEQRTSGKYTNHVFRIILYSIKKPEMLHKLTGVYVRRFKEIKIKHLYMSEEIVNWSGSIRFTPREIYKPTTEKEVIQLVQQAIQEGRKVRVMGKGHSSTGVIVAEDMLLSLEKMKDLESYNKEERWAFLQPGLTIEEAGEKLLEVGLGMENMGDINYQKIAGAIGTGTHGTGKWFPNISGQLIGGRIVNGRGELVHFSADKDKDLWHAAQVAMGTLGIFTSLQLRLLPAFKLHRREWWVDTEYTLTHLDELIEKNRNFDFYWYPRADVTKVRIWNLPGQGMQTLHEGKLAKEQHDWGTNLLANEQKLKYEEMEYAIPAEAGPECFREVRERVLRKHRQIVGWRILYRTIARDEGKLSPFFGRDSVTISLHQNNMLPFWPYFNDIEPIFRAYGGRPHWAKKHTLKAKELEPLYPEWSKFMEIRKRMDPEGIFLNDYFKDLFGIE
jgi:FAD/FMN-containing dehydrogenase